MLVRRFEQRAAQPPAAGRRPAGRRHRRRARAARRAARRRPTWSSTPADLSVHDLRRHARARVRRARRAPALRVTVLSFGFKYGLPMDADLVVDVRFLPNPHWIPELRDAHRPRRRRARLRAVARRAPAEFLDRYIELLRLVGAGYRREGKRYLTVGDRLHRRQAPQRRDGRGDRQAAGRATACRPRSRTATWGASERATAAGGRARRRARPAASLAALRRLTAGRHRGRHRGRRRRLVRPAAPRAGPAAAGRPADGAGRAGRRRRLAAAPGPACCSTASAAPARWPATPVGNLLLDRADRGRSATRWRRSTWSPGWSGAVGRVLPMSPQPLDIAAEVTGLDDADPGRVHRIRGQVAVATTPGRVAVGVAGAAGAAGLPGGGGRGRGRRPGGARAGVVVHQRAAAPAGARAARRAGRDRGPPGRRAQPGRRAGRDRRLLPAAAPGGALRRTRRDCGWTRSWRTPTRCPTHMV